MIEYHWFKTEKIFQSRTLTSLKKSSLVPDFLFSLLRLFTRVTTVTVHNARYLVHLNTVLSVRLLQGFAYLLCWPLERGMGLVCRQTFSWIFQLFFYLLLFLSIFFFYPRRFTYTHCPWPTTFSYTQPKLPINYRKLKEPLRKNKQKKTKRTFFARPQKM